MQRLGSAGSHGAMHNQIGKAPSHKLCHEFALALALGTSLAACGSGGSNTTIPTVTEPSVAARLGSQIFADTALSADAINGVIAFLCTFTDGFDPNHPESLIQPAHCQAAVKPFVSF